MAQALSPAKKLLFSSILVAILLAPFAAAEFLIRRNAPQMTFKQAQSMYSIDGQPDYGIPYYRTAPGLPFGLKAHYNAAKITDSRYPKVDMNLALNEEGFRTYPFPASLPDDEFRVLVLGDSATFGYGVKQGETFADDLERLIHTRWNIPKVRAYNLGVPGYGPAEYYMLLKQYAPRLKPHLVIVALFMANDPRDVDVDRINWDAQGHPVSVSRPENSVASDGHLRYRGNAAYRIPGLRNMHFAIWLQEHYNRLNLDERWRNYRLSQAKQDRYAKWVMVLTALQDRAQELRIPTIWVRLPNEGILASKDWTFEDRAFMNVPFRDQIVNLTPALDKPAEQRSAAALFADPSHLSALGHRLVAEQLFAQMNPRYKSYAQAIAHRSGS